MNIAKILSALAVAVAGLSLVRAAHAVVPIPLVNSDFESPVWQTYDNVNWFQAAVAPGTEPSNSNTLDPRFGTPGWAKTAESGGGPGPNGEGIYSERNDLGYNQYFTYSDGHLPSPANGANFFCVQSSSSGGTYHFWADEQPNVTGDQGNSRDINYPAMIAPTLAQAGHTYQVTVALGNPRVNTGSVLAADVELDFTIGAGSYYGYWVNSSFVSDGNAWNYATKQQAAIPSDPNCYCQFYNGYGTTVASAFARGNSDSNWHIAPGTFQDLSLQWTCPSADNGLPLDVQMIVGCYSGASVAMDNVRLVDETAPEPATLTLLATGLISALAHAWRRRRAQRCGPVGRTGKLFDISPAAR